MGIRKVSRVHSLRPRIRLVYNFWCACSGNLYHGYVNTALQHHAKPQVHETGHSKQNKKWFLAARVMRYIFRCEVSPYIFTSCAVFLLALRARQNTNGHYTLYGYLPLWHKVRVSGSRRHTPTQKLTAYPRVRRRKTVISKRRSHFPQLQV